MIFRLRNINIVGLFNCFNCYMFRSYDNLHADVFSRIYPTDNESVVSSSFFFLEY
jgi:predicted amino acid racemase